MKEISKEEFYKLIGPRDICVSSSYEKKESYFKTRSGVLVGVNKRTLDENEDEVSTYYIDVNLLPPEVKE